MIDFDRANQVGLDYVQSWVPGGKQEGNEYKALNPTRADKKIGSFSINMISGLWKDWADYEEAKGDVVALYAYLNRSSLKGSSDAEIQVEAAKEILRVYDGQSITDTKFKKETGPWAGYHCLTSGHPEPPAPNYKWHAEESIKKPFEKDWDFHNKKGVVVFKVARFRDSSGKVDKPFSLWQNGDVIKWRSINIPGKKPLYNLPDLMDRQSFSVLLTEGQKNAEDSKLILKNDFVTTCVYGNLKDVDFEPLRGRRVYIWADPDSTGAKKASKLKEILLSIDCEVHLVRSPKNREKFDISDAINEGWTGSQLVEHIENEPAVGQTVKEEIYIEDGLPFKVVGVNPGYIYIYSNRTRMVVKHKDSSLGKNSLMNLMDLKKWRDLFPGPKESVNWDEVVNIIFQYAEKAPLWDSSLVRGAGAWRDKGGKIIVSTGESIIVDGEYRDLMSNDSKYVYNRVPYRPYSIEGTMDNEESARFFEIFQTLSFESDLQKIFLAGWAFLAPFGGLLKWRPMVWLTGGAGSGKSTVMRIINGLMDSFSEKVVANGSSEAGIRQRLNNCAVPVTIDEMESNDKYSKETVQLLLSMARQASTGGNNTPEILKGTSDGMGASFKINSMFFFASIQAAIEQRADMDRIEILELSSPKDTEIAERKIKYSKLLSLEQEIITPDFKNRFYSRSLSIIEETLKAVDTFVSLSADILMNQRGGDQKGTLLAGAYMISHDIAPTPEQAIEWASNFDLVAAREENAMKSDSERCFDIIMESKVTLNINGCNNSQAIGLWIEQYNELIDIEKQTSPIPKQIAGDGIRLNRDNTIDIAKPHNSIKKILRDTGWDVTYGKVLKGHPEVVKKAPATARFNGISKSIIRIKIDDCPI